MISDQNKHFMQIIKPLLISNELVMKKVILILGLSLTINSCMYYEDKVNELEGKIEDLNEELESIKDDNEDLKSKLDDIQNIASDGESSASYARDEDYETMNDALYECEDIFSEICNIADY